MNDSWPKRFGNSITAQGPCNIPTASGRARARTTPRSQSVTPSRRAWRLHPGGTTSRPLKAATP